MCCSRTYFFTKELQNRKKNTFSNAFYEAKYIPRTRNKILAKLRSLDPKIIAKHLQNELHKNIMIKPGLSQKCTLADE